jgi:hypothetical protein
MLILLAWLLQTPDTQIETTRSSLEHIRHNLDRVSTLSAPPPAVPIFRVSVTEHWLILDRPWRDDGVVPPYVHTPQPIYHHEFLAAVTPEEFRSATLYPFGVPVMPTLYAARKAIARSVRAYNQTRARERVRRDLERFLAENCGGRLCAR